MRSYRGNISTVSIRYRNHLTPSIVGIAGYNRSRIVDDRNDITLQVLIEIICSAVMFQTANSAIEIIKILIDILRTIANIGYDFLNNVCCFLIRLPSLLYL